MNDSVDTARFFACKAEDLDNNEIIKIEPRGKAPIAVYRVQGEFFATDSTCTHGAGDLADGEVDEDYVIECPFHGGTFDVRTGEAIDFPCVVPLKSYPVIVEDGEIYINLDAGEVPS